MNPTYNTPLLTLNGILNVCSKCLTFFPTSYVLNKHIQKCKIPFKAIFEEESFKITKLTSIDKKQNMCLLSQLFLQTKTLYFELHNYDIFIIYQDEIYGYFSRCREGKTLLDCFMVFPCFQNQRFGTLLLDFSQIKSYSQNKDENVQIGMTKPYSENAIKCFRKYWSYKVIGAKTIKQISNESNLSIDAIIGLELQGFDFKKWKHNGIFKLKKPRLLSKNVYKINHIN